MMTLQFADTHNMVAFLSKPAESEGFEQIVDFLNANPNKYALTINPTIYTSCIEQFWATIKAKTINEEVQLQALVNGKKVIITESTVRRDLHLKDAEGVDCEGSANPTDPHHTPIIIQPSTSQPQKKQKPRKPKRKDTEVPLPSGPINNVADEAVYKEMDDSLERAATTATSLDAEQDRGNINKTQSKATLNEPSSLGTSSGSGPRRQETMGDTIAQTGFENVSKTSNDSLLAGVNTPRSDEDSLKLKELMELCTNLQNRVIDLEKTKTSQAQEIISLKRRVKRLEKKNRSKTHGLKRLYKVGLSARIESSEDEGLGEEDASKQGRIDDIDANEDIYLVNVHRDEDMFGVNDLEGDEVNVEIDVDHEVVVETQVASKDVKLSVDEVTLAQALAALKSAKPEDDKVKVQDKGKGIMVEEPLKMKKKNQITKDMFDYQLGSKELQAQEQEELTDEEKARLFVQFLEQRRKHFVAKRVEEKRNRPPTRAQQKSIMCTYLKNMEVWKPKSLKNKSFVNIQELFEKLFSKVLVNTFVEYKTEFDGKRVQES
ncbi:hypothetical protein Tco_0332027 [Tanacetum coccineum]